MYVYVIGPTNGPYKIGFTNNLKKRLGALQNASPYELLLHHSLQAGSITRAQMIESAAHATLAAHRMRGEWFDCDLTKAITAVVDDGHPLVVEEDNRRSREMELAHISANMTEEQLAMWAGYINCPSTDRAALIQWRLDQQDIEMAERIARRRGR